MSIRDHLCLTEHQRNFSPLGFTIRKTHDFQQVCVSLLIAFYILVVLYLCIVAYFLYVYVYVVMCMQVTHMCVQMCMYTCGIQTETSSLVPRVSSNFSFLLKQSLLGPGLMKNNRKSRHRGTVILLLLLPMTVQVHVTPPIYVL